MSITYYSDMVLIKYMTEHNKKKDMVMQLVAATLCHSYYLCTSTAIHGDTKLIFEITEVQMRT